MTKNEHWDYYLSLLQPKLDQARSEELQWLANSAEANEPRVTGTLPSVIHFQLEVPPRDPGGGDGTPSKLLAASQADSSSNPHKRRCHPHHKRGAVPTP